MIDMLKALAENNRLRIVTLLADGPLCVCELVEKLGLPQNLVSHHLSILKQANLVEDCRCGKKHFYSLNTVGFEKIESLLCKIIPEAKNQINCKRK